MGGIGSGKRLDSKSTTDTSLQLDIRYLRKKGSLSPGTTGTLKWSIAGADKGSINFIVHDTKLELYLRYTINGGEAISAIKSIYFDKTVCNYGGERTWFLCPKCGKRVEILYLKGKSFICRKCADLNYQSQHEQPLHRMLRRARKVRHKLNTDWFEPDNLISPVLFKPKGMHLTTFDRLQRQQRGLLNSSGLILLDKFDL